MKINLLLLTFLVSVSISYGQDQFIEVEVSDTIMCKIDVMNYVLLVKSEGDKSVSKYLDQAKLSYSKRSHFGSNEIFQFYIAFTSKDEIKGINKEFENSSTILDANSIGNVHELTEEEIEILYRKILKKGEVEAKRIAKAMEKTNVELLESKYKIAEDKLGGWTAYPPLSAMSNVSIEIPEDEEMVKTRTMVLRYRVN